MEKHYGIRTEFKLPPYRDESEDDEGVRQTIVEMYGEISTNLTPAMQKARERHAREVFSFKKAREELARTAHKNWASPIDHMFATVYETGVSLGTVNLAYHQLEKANKETE